MNPELDRHAITIAAALREGQAQLSAARTDTPRLDAEVLLRHALDLDRTALFARLTELISPLTLSVYQDLLAQRARGVPVAYITGQREFMGLPFMVAPGVLVPRPETEILVEWALSTIRQRNLTTVVDVGTGSGAIAVSIAAHMGPEWDGRVIAADVSPAALAVASENWDPLIETARVRPSSTVVSQGEAWGEHAGNRGCPPLPSPPAPSPCAQGEGAFAPVVGDKGVRADRLDTRPEISAQSRVGFVRGSLLTWLRGPVDLVLANLPYLRPEQIATNLDLAAEPRQALDGGEDGLDLIRRLVADAPRVLAPGGALGLEIDPSQSDEVSRLVRRGFPDGETTVLRDLAGRNRHVVVQTGRGRDVG